MDLIKDILYDTGKPMSQLYEWLHGLWLKLPVAVPPVVLDIILMLVVAGAGAAFIALNALFIIYYERKFSARLQIRKGPNRVGPLGTVQTIADTVKLMLKEDINPKGIDTLAFWVAPFLVFIPTFAVFLVIPFGKGIIAGDINIGILYVAAISGLAVIGLFAAGWGSNNKYALIGGLRSAAQVIGYEIPMMLVIISVILLAGSLKMSDIVAAQSGGIHKWFVLPGFVGFILFLIAGNAEINRAPFDLPEAESELVAGFNTEYSGMKFAMFYLAEYTNLFLTSAIAVTLFLGGWQGPLLPPIVWFLIKTYFVITILMWARWTYPRIRVDQLMSFAWKILLPIALLNLVITAIAVKFIG